MAAFLDFDARRASIASARPFAPLALAHSLAPTGFQCQRPKLCLRWKMGPNGRPVSDWEPQTQG
ncbi:hypothetical protein [Nitrospirillum pindoramense]|uniref:Uncharacterized protein n=1 Tax=Nitrospirillum amazonense TaxID=28077 RepID=A0A560HF12_9PROT|nr:hypothetical protein [Nitrospirillum amazonense]TWB44229.1 hypothetical protein FBZ90_103135 [Nitrospirillum amazonense]